MTIYLAEFAFRDLSGLLEDWIMGLARLWLTAYPVQLDAASTESAGTIWARLQKNPGPVVGNPGGPDRDAILGGMVGRVWASWRTRGRPSGSGSSTIGSTWGVPTSPSGRPSAS